MHWAESGLMFWTDQKSITLRMMHIKRNEQLCVIRPQYFLAGWSRAGSSRLLECAEDTNLTPEERIFIRVASIVSINVCCFNHAVLCTFAQPFPGPLFSSAGSSLLYTHKYTQLEAQESWLHEFCPGCTIVIQSCGSALWIPGTVIFWIHINQYKVGAWGALNHFLF